MAEKSSKQRASDNYKQKRKLSARAFEEFINSRVRIVFNDSKVIEAIVLKQYTYEIIVDKFNKDKSETKKALISKQSIRYMEEL
jgi:GTP-binding protein EngB required for normal cell division